MKIVKSQSFKVKPSFFFEEKTSLPILKVLYNNPKLNSDPNLLEEKKELLNQTNPPEFKEMIENDKILLSEPIFNELCSQSKYSKGNKCVVCDGKFGILKQRKNCGFCGEAVCGEHREKKRPNPKNEKEIVKICEICERKYLEKMIYQVFLMKKNMKNKEIFGIEQELSKTKEESKIKKKEIFSLLTEKEESERLLREKMNKLIEKLNFTKKRIEDVEEENRELSSTYENINQNIKNEEKKIYQYNKLSVQLKKKLEERNHELKHLDSKIIENETTLQNLEAQISRHKYKKKNQNFNEERQEQIEIFNSYMKSNISDGEGSLHSQNYSINKKDACLKNNDVCLCSIF